MPEITVGQFDVMANFFSSTIVVMGPATPPLTTEPIAGCALLTSGGHDRWAELIARRALLTSGHHDQWLGDLHCAPPLLPFLRQQPPPPSEALPLNLRSVIQIWAGCITQNHLICCDDRA